MATNANHHTNYLRSILEKKLYVLDTLIPDEPPVTPRAPHADWSKHVDDSVDVSSLMLATMISELQEIFENHTAFDMINHLKEMFQ